MGEAREITELFRLEKVLKSSLSGVVFRATDPQSGRRVAIKLINRGSSPDQSACRQRFEAAVERVRALGPAAFPVILDAGITPDGTAFLVLEYLEATGVDHLAGGPPDRTARLLADVAMSLAAVAGAGVVHHNICPENLLLVTTPAGEAIKMVGFGSAAFRPEGLGISAAGGTASLAFAAPELVAGGAEAADWRADLYSFSLVACQLLGAQVVVGDGGEQTVVASPTLAAEIPQAAPLLAALQRCLRPEPADRHTSFDEISIALSSVLGGGPEAGVGASDETRAIALPPPPSIAPPPVLSEPPRADEPAVAAGVSGPTAEDRAFETQAVSREKVAQTLAMSVREIKEGPAGPPAARAADGSEAGAPPPATESMTVMVPTEPPGGLAVEPDSSLPEEEKRTMRIDVAEIRATPPPPPPGVPDAAAPSQAPDPVPPTVPPPTFAAEAPPEPAAAISAAASEAPGGQEAGTLPNETVLIPQLEREETRLPAVPGIPTVAPEAGAAPSDAAGTPSLPVAGETVEISHLATPGPPLAAPTPESPPPVSVAAAPPLPSAEPQAPAAAVSESPSPQVAAPAPAAPQPAPRAAAAAARPTSARRPKDGRPWLLLVVVFAALGLLAVTVGVIVTLRRSGPAPVAAAPTPLPTPRPAATPMPTAVPAVVRSLEEAERALAANDVRAARAAVDAISVEDEKVLTAAEADRLATVRDALGEKRRGRLAANLARGLSTGNVDLLGRTIAELSADDVRELSGSRRDEERLKLARRAVDLNAAVQNAFRDRRYLEAVKQATALLTIVPKAGQAADARERSAKVLDAEAEAAVKNGDFEAGLKGYESLREAWPDRPGIAARIEEAHAAQKADEALASTLAAISRTGEEGHPEKGLAMLGDAKPNARWEPRFAQVKERLERRLAELDKQPPVVRLKPGYKLEYEKNKPATVLLHITDDLGVKSVSAMGRREDTKQYSTLGVKAIGGGDYEIDVPASFHGNDTVEFYVVAADASGHTTSLGTAEAPLKLKRKRWLF